MIDLEQSPLMNRDLYIHIIDTITPIFEDTNLRQVVANEAFFGNNILQKINYAGGARVFTSQLVSQLFKHGEIDAGRQAIIVLLDTIISGNYVGNDKTKIIKTIIHDVSGSLNLPHTIIDEIEQKTKRPKDTTIARNTVECKICGFQNSYRADICNRCKQSLNDVEQTMIGKPPQTLSLLVHDHDGKFDIELLNNKTEMLIGRRDQHNFNFPDVDLALYDGHTKGVSRLHASLKWDKDIPLVYITDLNSRYGTLLNGSRIAPNKPHVLSEGDTIQLGYMVLHVKYRKLLFSG